jgi:hypothetical protein
MRRAILRANGLVSILAVSEGAAPGGSTNMPRPAAPRDVMVSTLAVEALNIDFYTVVPMDRLNPKVTQSRRR